MNMTAYSISAIPIMTDILIIKKKMPGKRIRETIRTRIKGGTKITAMIETRGGTAEPEVLASIQGEAV